MRAILFLLGLFHAANGIAMLIAPLDWYAAVPGVTETGPANGHFIRDIGLAFVAAGLSLILASRRAIDLRALAPGAAFLAGHVGLHVVEIAVHGTTAAAALRDFFLIAVPGLVPLFALWRGYRQPERLPA